MSRAQQQSSIRSFFQPRRAPEYAAPPSSAPPRNVTAPPPPPPPPAPPLPTTAASPVPVPIPVAVPVALPPNGIPTLPPPPSLPLGASIVPLAEHHVPALRRINSLLLPVPYPDSFYAKALDPLASGLFSRAILWQDSDADTPKVIGGLVCRLEPNPFLDAQGQPLPSPPQPSSRQRYADIPLDTPYHAIYIQSLALLSPYRSLGLAAAALEHIIASATLLPAAGSSVDVRTVYAHVWTENEEGLKWYEARGFARDAEPVKGYYFKLRPDTAWVVRRHIGPSSVVTASPFVGGTSATSAASSTVTGGAAGSVLAAAINLQPISSGSSAPPPAPTEIPQAAAALPSPSSSLPPPPPATRTALLRQLQQPPPPSSSPAPPTTTTTTTTTSTARLGSGPTPSPAPSSTSTLSFQNARPQTEWNDLPADMVMPTTTTASNSSSNLQQQQQQYLTPPVGVNGEVSKSGSRPGSGASSRSSSTSAARKRKERAYPSAAFGQ